MISFLIMKTKKHLKVPLTIITGYLGSGKTTLLRNIINKSKMKIAILMNEFGDVSIDGKIIEGKNIKMSELSGGCVCCSLSGEFEAAIGEILEKVNPEWIVVETTGVAEPTALAYDVVENIPSVRLDAIVTVVDSDAMVRFPSLGHTGREQIELADLLILNKTDLVSSDQLDKIKEKLLSLNEKAQMIETQNSDFDITILFGIKRDTQSLVNQKHLHKIHKIEFEYFDYTNSRALSYDKFIAYLPSVPKEIYRLKGFIKTDKGDYLINFVNGRFTIEEFSCEKTELVFIGKDINKFSQIIFNDLSSALIY